MPHSKINHATAGCCSFSSNTCYDDERGEDVAGDDREDDSVAVYGSNDGVLQLPYIYTRVTHPPEGDEMGRTKKVHLVIHLLSGTHAKMGYTVSCAPKGNEIIVTHQKGMESIFWGHTGRAMVPAGIARDQLTLACSTMTTNFTNVPRQVQTIEFPFAIDKILTKKPFFVNAGNGPGQQFLGLYVCAKVDWTDVEAECAGDDYTELRSPDPHMNSPNPFYNYRDSASSSTEYASNRAATSQRSTHFTPSTAPGIGGNRHSTVGLSGAVPEVQHSTSNGAVLAPSVSEQRILEMLMDKINVRGDIHGMNESNISYHSSSNAAGSTSRLTPSKVSRANFSTTKQTPTKSTSGFTRGFSSGFGAIFKKTSLNEGTATTVPISQEDESNVSYDLDDNDDAEEVYNEFH